MALSKTLVEDFQSLYLEIFKQDIEYSVAELELQELADLVRSVQREDDKDE